MRFEQGAPVEVFDVKREIWIPAVVIRRWREQAIEGGRAVGDPTDAYDVEGTDDEGPFNGRWEGKYVRGRDAVL